MQEFLDAVRQHAPEVVDEVISHERGRTWSKGATRKKLRTYRSGLNLFPSHPDHTDN